MIAVNNNGKNKASIGVSNGVEPGSLLDEPKPGSSVPELKTGVVLPELGVEYWSTGAGFWSTGAIQRFSCEKIKRE